MVISIGAVQAGGSWFEPSSVRVEAGDHVELTATVYRGSLGWVEDGPFFVYLQGDEFGTVISEGYGGAATDVLLGELALGDRVQALAASADVTIPVETPPGAYSIVVCDDPCTTGLGDLIGAVLYVGIDPPVTAEEVAPAAPTGPTAATATALPIATEPTTRPLSQRLALSPYPERPADISPIWVGISAALAGAVLLTALLTRQRG